MPEFQSLATIKNAFLAPLGRSLSSTLSAAQAAADRAAQLTATAKSHATRHDHHNIEIKTVSELGATPSIVETNLYFFVPRNFEITATGKVELMRDFRSRMRLALPVAGSQGAAAFENALEALQASLNRLEEIDLDDERVFDLNHPLYEEALEATKDLCAVVSGTLKHCSVEHARQCFLSHSLLATSDSCITGLDSLAIAIRTVYHMIERVRSTAASAHSAPNAAFALLDEYVSQRYVQYLGTIREELNKIGRPPQVDANSYDQGRRNLETLLDRLQKKEAKHRLRFGAKPVEDETDLDRERRLVRLSHLKKFFQSKTFVDVSRHQSAKRVSESTAAAGTACAGIVAALIERFSQPEVGNVAFHGLFVLTFGVIVYVLRDRMKDWAKAHLHEKALKFLPDYEQQLMAKDKRIGTSKEWYRVRSTAAIPEDILKLRRAASASEMEKRLPEDVLHCRKVQEVDSSLLASTNQTVVSRALHENTRVNFERYLKHMDDPFKELTDLDASGRFRRSRSHRVYHFYLCVKTSAGVAERRWRLRVPFASKKKAPAPRKEVTLVYRIVLDKNGVVRIEDMAPNA